jgi:tetratricopeptide (TPR) repeat protein
MTSERIQRQIDRLLDEAEDAITREDWPAVAARARAALRLDPENADALAYLAAAEGPGEAAPAAPHPAPVATPATPQPTSFASGRYEVRRFLGEGGKKKVYLAHDAQLDRDVAFALIKTEGLDEAARIRVTREAQAMGRLGSHPHIVTVYDMGEEPVRTPGAEPPGSTTSQPYLVLPVLPGGDVEGVIEKAPDHKLSIEQAVKIATETCLGLEFSHSKGIIHRDLKPGNVWLAEDGRAMIGDFGLAVAVDRSRLTQAGMMVGTVSYMPPEQAMGGEVTPQSDLYSLGAMLYEMVCGRPPFVGDESVAIIGQHLNTPPVAPSWHRPDCPPGLEALILRLLEKDATKRPASASEVRQALQAVAGSPLPLGEGGRRPGEGGAPSTTGVTSPTVDPLYRRTFVGRENETRQLHQVYDAAVSGQGGLVMVVGEPGIGKTAICEQLATYVQLRGGKTLVGHCYEEGSLSLPYLAFVEAMRSYVLARDPESLRSELGTGAAEVARIVSEVRDRVQLPQTARPEALEGRNAGNPEDDRWRLLNAVSSFLRNAASVQPLVIVLEDLHWADRGTLDLLLHIARNLEGTRLLIVGTYRDVEVDRTHPLSATLGDLRRINTFLRLPLRGLTVDEVHRMYEAIRGQSVQWGQAEAVHRATEGNPLFVQEILRYLVEEGIVVRQDGQYVTSTPGEGIPDGLRDVVGRRLSHLGDNTNQALSIASVIGRDFRLDVLRHVSGLAEDEVLEALEEATERSIIEQRPATGSIGFRFTHAFFRQVLYEEIFVPRRIRWHQQVGAALEEIYVRRLDDHAAELAEHFAQSTEIPDLQKALRYCRQAYQRAMSVFAYGEAVRHAEQGLRVQEVLDPNDDLALCDLWLALGEALMPAGEPMRAAETIAPEAFRLAETLRDAERASLACQMALRGMLRYGTPAMRSTPEWRTWAGRADRFATPGTISRVHADLALAGVEYAEREFAASRKLTRAAMALAQQLGDSECIFYSAWILLLDPYPGTEAIEMATRVAAVPRHGASPRTLAGFFILAWSTFLRFGDRRKAEAIWAEVEELGKRTQDPNVVLQPLLISVTRKTLAGELEDAMETMQKATERGDELGIHAYGQTLASALSYRAALYLGRAPDFEELDGGVTPKDALRALADAHSGHAVEGAGDIRALLSGPEKEHVDRIGYLGLEVAGLAEDPELAALLFDSVSEEASPSGAPAFDFTCIGRHLGRAAVLLGRPDDARGYYQRGLAACESIDSHPELALTHLGLAELLLDHYPEEHDTAIQHLDFAIAEFREMKMRPALERALGRRGLLKA